MITGFIFPYLIFIFKLLSKIGLSPYEWDDKLQRFRHAVSYRKYTWRVWHFISFCHFSFILWRLISYLLHPEDYQLPFIEKVVFFYWLTSLAIIQFTVLICVSSHLNDRLALFNGLILMESKVREKIIHPHGILMTDSGGRYLLLYFTTITLVSILLPSFFWIFPCGPQFVGTTFFGLTCSGSVDVFLVAKLLISYLIELALVVGCCGPTLIFGTVAILSPMCLNTYLKFFRDMSNIPIVRWRVIQYQLMFYRQIQLVQIYQNLSFRYNFLPCLEAGGSTFAIGSLFVFLILFGEIPMLGTILFLVFYIVVEVFLIVILQAPSKSVSLSKAVLKSVYNRRTGYNKRRLSIILKSCAPIKIYIGDFHVVEKERFAIVSRFILQRTFGLATYFKQKVANNQSFL